MNELKSGSSTGAPSPQGRPLVAITYLAPGIPLEFFESVTRYLTERLDRPIELISETRSSGPMHGHDDPFADGRADIGFLCSPSYLYLRSQAAPSVRLVPAGFVFRDERNAGDPVYYSDVVVRADDPAQGFEDLQGRSWGFNDECSLSGYFATRQELLKRGHTSPFFGRTHKTGSHHASIDAVLDGSIDGASIDSVALGMMRRRRPELSERLRVVESWGPFPIQPVVVRSDIDAAYHARITEALLGLGESRVESGAIVPDLAGCVPIDDSAYAEERRDLCDLGELPR